MTSPKRQFKANLYGQLARVGKALSSATRLEILDLLCQGPRSVEAIAAEVEQSVANTSHHLQALRRSGLVESERDGVALAYWHDGPLASSIATRLPRAEARQIAEAVRRAMHEAMTAPRPLLQPDFRTPDDPGRGVVADTLGAPIGTERPVQASDAARGEVRPN